MGQREVCGRDLVVEVEDVVVEVDSEAKSREQCGWLVVEAVVCSLVEVGCEWGGWLAQHHQGDGPAPSLGHVSRNTEQCVVVSPPSQFSDLQCQSHWMSVCQRSLCFLHS